jgi:hypothetical protein
MSPDFIGFPKMARLNRDIVITEKIDGTNAQVYITEDGDIFAGSRTRWVNAKDDNFGFGDWVEGNKSDLLYLGPGRHFGEWMGKGIQRNYGLKERRFLLFNVVRWALYGTEPQLIESGDPRIIKYQQVLPECCGLVPLIYSGPFKTNAIELIIKGLEETGSVAVPGFMNPEGIVVFHTSSNFLFKVTVKNDEKPKGMVKSGQC